MNVYLFTCFFLFTQKDQKSILQIIQSGVVWLGDKGHKAPHKHKIIHEPFNSHKWPRQNFSLLYQYNIKQASDEDKETYILEDY